MAYEFKALSRFRNTFLTMGVGIQCICMYGMYGEVTKEKYVAKIKRKYVTGPLSKIHKAYMIELDNGQLIKSKRQLWQEPPYYWDVAEEGEEYNITTRGLNRPQYGIYPNLYYLGEK